MKNTAEPAEDGQIRYPNWGYTLHELNKSSLCNAIGVPNEVIQSIALLNTENDKQGRFCQDPPNDAYNKFHQELKTQKNLDIEALVSPSFNDYRIVAKFLRDFLEHLKKPLISFKNIEHILDSKKQATHIFSKLSGTELKVVLAVLELLSAYPSHAREALANCMWSSFFGCKFLQKKTGDIS